MSLLQNKTFLRGIQATNEDGYAQFETIFPGTPSIFMAFLLLTFVHQATIPRELHTYIL